MAIKASSKGVVGDHTLVGSFYMRGLLLLFPLFSKMNDISLPGFRAFSKLRTNQKPEIAHSLSHSLPTKVLSGGLMRSMSGSAQ
eukprot:6087309-Amphidinium_carterae.1